MSNQVETMQNNRMTRIESDVTKIGDSLNKHLQDCASAHTKNNLLLAGIGILILGLLGPESEWVVALFKAVF